MQFVLVCSEGAPNNYKLNNFLGHFCFEKILEKKSCANKYAENP